MSRQPSDTRSARPFPRNWIFLCGVPSMRFIPPEGPPEIAFAGRSNVGKSSLINALVRRKALARTSNTPGRTQELNFFVPGGHSGADGDLPPLAIVDMPGYGFARAPRGKVERWTRFIFDYLRGRASLKRVFLLIDARHGIKQIDRDAMDTLDKAAVSYQIVLTKIDKIGKTKVEPLLNAVLDEIKKRGAAFPEVIATSAEDGTGLDELRDAVMAFALPIENKIG